MTNQTQTSYFQLLDRLANFGETLSRSRIGPQMWHEYLQSGFDQSHVPDLIRILDDTTVYESEFNDTAMAPIHAWRILAELKATEAVPALLSILHRIDDENYDWIGEEYPDVFSKIGPASLNAIESYARNPQNGEFARICTFRVISQIGADHPAQRAKCVEILTDLLRAYETNDLSINAFLISALSDLNALESFDVVRAAYEKDRVELSVLGDVDRAEYHFRTRPEDRTLARIMAEERLGNFRQWSTSRPFEPAQIVEKSRPIISGPKIGRNDPCHCGSGRKYKKCCGP
ncbi:hypothetical protein P3T23_009685 [Paraburkholderia sp. GAS448]